MKYRVLQPLTHLGVNYSADAHIDLDPGTAYQLLAKDMIGALRSDPASVQTPVPAKPKRAPRKSKGD